MMITSSPEKQRSVPAYRQIENDLRGKIEAGHWAIGVMLPSRKDLAQQYRVSVPTVERAIATLLTDGTLRADGGRGTFVAAAPKFNKSPESRAVARQAAPRRIKAATVGIISSIRPYPGHSSKNQWPGIIINSLERTVTAHSGVTRFFDLSAVRDERDGVADAIDALLQQDVNAFVVVFADKYQKNEETAYVRSTDLPIVFVGPCKSRQPMLSVYYDSHDAGFQTAQHLLDSGCSSLLFFAPYTVDWVQERVAGAREAVLLAGLPANTLQLRVSDRGLADVLKTITDEPMAHIIAARDAARTLLAQSGGLLAQGVIAANDHVAIGFEQAATEINLTAGKDYALIGFDDQVEARMIGLSTLRPPLEEMGREAGRLIFSALDGPIPPMHVCLHSHLIARISSQFS